ncbi:hypothetical protein TSMEX_005569 [Taenia solium]|eukprot:TsM_001028900 transcript=TsM_001028900 gene=TsM_001028900
MKILDPNYSVFKTKVWDLKRAVGCEGFLEPDIGLEPNRIVLVLVRSAINAKANQLLEMIEQVQTLLKHFLVLESVREIVRYMWDLLFQKIATKLRNDEYDAGEKAIYLEVGRRIIKQLKQLGVNTFRYVSNLEASIIRKSVTDAIIKHQDPFPETPVVPNVDLGDLLKTIKEISWKSLSSFGQITPTIHFSIKEAVEETKSIYSMAAPSSSGGRKKLPSSSSTTSIAISVDLPLAEKQPTITEGELSPEPSDSEVVWLPSTGRGMVSTSTAADSQFVDFESFDEVPEDLLAKRLYEAYGGEMRGTRTSLIRKAQEIVENPTVFDVAELRSSKSFDLENVDEMELELAVAKVIQKMEDEEATTRLTRIATPEIEEVETLEMRLARIRTLIAERRPNATEEESPKEIETVSLIPPLPPYRADVVKYQLRNIIEELKMSRSNQQGLNALERVLWITLPENLADRYELFVRVADLQRRGQFSGEALKALLESVLVDVTDLLTLLDPDFEIEDEQRYNIYDQLRTNLDVLCWFKIDIDGYEEQLREYPELMQFGGSLTKVVDVETPQPWHMVTFQGTGVDLKLGSVDSEEESVEKQSGQINETIQFAPLADLLTEEIKKRMHEAIFEKTFRNELVPIYKKFREIGQIEHSKQFTSLKKNLEGELFSELPPTQNQTNKLAAYMKWRKNKLEMAGTTARCLFSVSPEIVDQDREIFREVIKLVDVQALSAEVATLFVSSTLQDLLDLMLISLNKDDFQKDERQMAYNQCRAMMEALQCFKVPIKEFKSNFDYCTDLEDQYKKDMTTKFFHFLQEIFTDGNFPTIGDGCEFFVALPQAYIQELPFEVLEAIGGRLRIEETEREPLKSYLKHIDAQAFVDQDKYDFERTRALAVHSLRLHPQDVNGMIKHEIEVLEEQKRKAEKESKEREGTATDVEIITDRWLGLRASADQAPTTSSPEMVGVSGAVLALEEGLRETPIDRGETMEVDHTMGLPSAEVLPEESKMDQQKEMPKTVCPLPDESTLIADTHTGAKKPRIKKLYTSPESAFDFPDLPSTPVVDVEKDVVKLLEKNKELEVQREKFARHQAAVEAAKKTTKGGAILMSLKTPVNKGIMDSVLFQLSVIYERLGDVSATAKRKAYDQTSRLRQEEEQHAWKKLQTRESGESVIAIPKSARVKESLRTASRISTKTLVGTKKKKLAKRRPTVESVSQKQPHTLPSAHLPPLKLKMATMMGEHLPRVVHKFTEIESIYSVSPLSPPPPSPPPSSRTKLPPLWPDQQKRWRNMFLYESKFEEVNVPKVEAITPIDVTIKNIQPLKPVRARKHYVDERVSYVARVAGPPKTMTSDTLTAISVEEGLPKRISHWFNRISRKETTRRRNIIPPSKNRISWQEVPDAKAVIRFPRPSMIASKEMDSAVVERQLKKSPRPEVSHAEANHRFITNELRTNLILKKLRMQLNTRDLVEVMIDLHTGRASKKTREIVETAYETIKDQKYTHLSDEATEKCRPQCRPNDLSSTEWKRIGKDVRSAHPFDEQSFPGYFIADSIGDGGRAHCEQEKMARMGAFQNDLTFGRPLMLYAFTFTFMNLIPRAISSPTFPLQHKHLLTDRKF